MDTASLASMRPKDWTRHILGLVSTQAVKTRNQKFIIDLKHRVLDLDPRTVDEVYGLEPVFEPDAGGQRQQHEGADLLRSELLVVDLHGPVGAHVSLHRADRPVDVRDRLPVWLHHLV